MEHVRDKVVVVTGASSGIGAATASLLAGHGAAVVLGARRTERIEALAGQIRAAGGRAVAVGTDVTEPAAVEALVARAVGEFGRLDVFVGNAGIARLSRLEELELADWNLLIDSNLRSVLHGLYAALPVFRRQGRGHLVTVVSTAGLKIVPTMAMYAATKNAVRTLMEGLRTESTDGAIRTTSISPGYIRTDLGNDPAASGPRSEMPAWALPPEAVARAVTFAVSQPDDVEIGDLTIRPTVQS